MLTHELLLNKLSSPEEVANFFQQKDVKKGDTVKVLADRSTSLVRSVLITMVMMAVIFHFDKKKRQEEGDKLLKNVFDGMAVEEIEKQVEQQYGINIEIHEGDDEERQFWQQAGLKSMEKEYGDEPDYSDIKLMEPNPEYKPWKKDQ